MWSISPYKLFFVGLILFCTIAAGCTKSRSAGSQSNAKTPTTATTTSNSTQEEADQVRPNDEQSQLNTTDRYWNDLARYLAGLEPNAGSVLDSIDFLPEAIKHRQFFQQVWPNIQKNHIEKLKTWAEAELKEEREQDKNVLYPFSGADFLHINTIYPNGKNYIMYGLEPEGAIPDLRAIERTRLPDNLLNIQYTLNTMLNMSFFRTSDMQRAFSRSDLTGTIPVLLVFLARTNNEVLSVRRFLVNRKGQKVYLYSDALLSRKPADYIVTGMEVSFRKSAEAPTQTVQYLSFDAQDIHLKNQTYLFDYFKTFGPTNTYFKSASYLMHWDIYGLIRNNIMEISDCILQDDTGIALRKYDKPKWNFQLYGNYIPPIAEFKGQYQQDLKQLYASSKVKPLDFGIGYHNDLGTSNLMIARKIK
jgi:hypothetical protein